MPSRSTTRFSFSFGAMNCRANYEREEPIGASTNKSTAALVPPAVDTDTVDPIRRVPIE